MSQVRPDDFKKLTNIMAEWVYQNSFGDIPKSVIDYSKLCLLDWLGVTLAGSQEKMATILFDLIKEMGGKEHATVLGKGIKTSVLYAALINGAMSHVLDYDDFHVPSVTHPSVSLIPAVLAVAEYKKKSGADLLTAFVSGFEAETRIGAAAGMSHYEAGWHSTGTVGHFGAAVGVAKLLNLDAEKIVHALGIAGTQAAGVRQVFGSMSKPFHPGKAAMNGTLAALLAEKGFTSSKEILEGKHGFLDIYSRAPEASKIYDGLGHQYQIFSTGFKPYPSCRATHSTIDALKELKKKLDREKINPEEIEEVILEVILEVNQFVIDPAGKINPRTGLEGKLSVYFCASLALSEEVMCEAMFTDEKVNDPVLKELSSKVKTEINNELSMLGAKVSISFVGGQRFEHFVAHPKGDPENPVSFEKLEFKFRGLAGEVVSDQERVAGVIEKIKFLDELIDTSELVTLCNP